MYFAFKFAQLLLAMICINCVTFNVSGLECYVCESRSNSADYCVKIHDNFKTNCPKKYCTIFRKELRDIYEGNNQLFYLNRSCSDQRIFPVSINLTQSNVRVYNTDNFRSDSVVVTTSDYKYYFQSCDNDLCNTGNGIDTDYDAKSDVIIVPGIGTNFSSGITSPTYVLYFVYVACILIMTNKFVSFS